MKELKVKEDMPQVQVTQNLSLHLNVINKALIIVYIDNISMYMNIGVYVCVFVSVYVY